MHFIQSHWSAPSQVAGLMSDTGGWPSNYYRYLAMLLSSLLLKRHYGRTELFTDKAGADWLIGELELPYHQVTVCLDELNAYSPKLWATPKLCAYSQQQKPFAHIDHDVFLWTPLRKELLSAPLVAQSPEFGFSEYGESFDVSTRLGLKLPTLIVKAMRSAQKYNAINAGVLGGTNTSFFAEYSALALGFLRANQRILASDAPNAQDVNLVRLNVLIEQYLFYHLALSQQLPLAFVVPEVNRNYSTILNLSQVPLTSTYSHLFGQTKRSLELCTQLEFRLRFEFPKHYSRYVQKARSHGLLPEVRAKSSFWEPSSSLPLPQTFNYASDELPAGSGQPLARAHRALQRRSAPVRRRHRWRNLSRAFELLNRSSLDDLLSQPLTLSKDVRITHSAAHSEVAADTSDASGIADQFTLLEFAEDNTLRAVPLSGFQNLLYYFQNRVFTGFDLLEALLDQHATASQRKATKLKIMEFICSELVYSGHLRPYQPRPAKVAATSGAEKEQHLELQRLLP